MGINKKLPSLHSRRMIYVDSQHNLDRMRLDDEGRKLLANEHIYSTDISDEILSNGSVVIHGERPSPGMVLILSPYDDNVYYELSEAFEKGIIEKAALIDEFCVYLGAKSVEVKSLKINSIEIKDFIDGKIKGKNKMVEGDVKAAIELAEYFDSRNSVDYVAKNTGGEANLEMAEKMLLDRHLNTEPMLRSLLNIVSNNQGSKGNKPVDRVLTISLSNTIKKSLNIVSSINVEALKTNVGVDLSFDSSKTEKLEVLLTIGIKF